MSSVVAFKTLSQKIWSKELDHSFAVAVAGFLVYTDMPTLCHLHRDLQESGKRKAFDPEAIALVSDDIIAKRQARFKTQEETAEEQRKQRFMDPDAVKAKERKERFGKWLPQESSGKISTAAVAAAIGTSLDNSMPAKGRAKAGSAAAAPKEEKYSAEFTAKAEVCDCCCTAMMHGVPGVQI